MNLLLVGSSYRNTPIEMREKLAFDDAKLVRALRELESRYGCESAIMSTCNRVELYLARPIEQSLPSLGVVAEFLAEQHGITSDVVQQHLYAMEGSAAILHLFRVASSLDSVVIGEGQIAGQVKQTYEKAQAEGTAGPILHALFQRANSVAGKVRTQTGISKGHVSVSSVAVDYVREVFEHFEDKTVLVIGAGKMGSLTLKSLKTLQPRRILVTNRSPEKAVAMAAEFEGQPVPWEQLDDALVDADIVVSTTGAPEPIMPRRRFDKILARRTAGAIVILDIAVPRDFDARIHDGDRAFVFNVDDLQARREKTLKDRHKHVQQAETIIAQELKKFQTEWARRRNGPIIARLTKELEARRKTILAGLLAKLNGLKPEEKEFIEGAFRLFQNQMLHGPITALTDEAHEPGRYTVSEIFGKIFGLED